MIDFKPGDEVVCVNAGPIPPPQGFPARPPSAGMLVEGQVYTVVALLTRFGEVGVKLREIEPEVLASRFRKVQRRDLSVWLATKNTIEDPKRVPATEDA